MWGDLSRLEVLRGRLDLLAAVLGILGAISVLLSRGPVAKRIAHLQAAEKEVLRNRVKKAEEASALLESRISAEVNANQRVQEVLRLELSGAKEEAVRASKVASRLKEAAEPRRLTSEQRAALIASLRACPERVPIDLEVPIGAAEAIGFANLLVKVFREAGWHVGSIMHAPLSGSPKGIYLRIVSKEQAPKPTAWVQKSFESVGIPAPGLIDPNGSVERLVVLVGYKQEGTS